ncbi:MAG: hypothetical protein JWO31_2921 [Phycisphaerales bacterium]|nr:hypothetical protein [Phycisphaerales bacterium]
MPDPLDHPIPPPLPYAPDADPGRVHIGRHDGGLTVVVPPVPLGRWVPAAFAFAAFGLLGFLVWDGSARRWRWPPDGTVLGMAAAFGAVVLFVAAYGYHLSRRHVRIDVDARHLRRSVRSPFVNREQCWDRRRVASLHRTDQAADDADGKNARAMWDFLMIRIRVGGRGPLERQHVLLDSPDPDELSAVEAALREALDLAAEVPRA